MCRVTLKYDANDKGWGNGRHVKGVMVWSYS